MGVIGHVWRFVRSPAGWMFGSVVASIVTSWAAAHPLIGLGCAVVLLQVATSPEFLLRARLGFLTGFVHNIEDGVVFGKRLVW